MFPLALAGLSAIVLDGTAGRPLGLAYLAGVIVGVFVYAVQVG